jgi:hypothetical protein
MNNPRKVPFLPATPKPGDFPIGSMESRAAARVVASAREGAETNGIHGVRS